MTKKLLIWPGNYNFSYLCILFGLKRKRCHSVWVQGYLYSLVNSPTGLTRLVFARLDGVLHKMRIQYIVYTSAATQIQGLLDVQ